jgi:hypothetical protein
MVTSLSREAFMSRLSRHVQDWKLAYAGMAVIALAVCVFFVRYRRYAYAIAWHCANGNYAEIGGHKVQLPLWWWKERAHSHETLDLQDRDEWLARACPSDSFPKPEINVSPAMPGEAAETDAQELDVIQRTTAFLNQNPPTGWSHSLSVLKASRFTFYCMQDHFAVGALVITNGLACIAPKIPYSFQYHGPPERLREAEAIFGSVQ